MEQSLDFIYDHFRDIEKDDLEYVYRGEVTAHLVMNILELAKTNLDLKAPVIPMQLFQGQSYFAMS